VTPNKIVGLRESYWKTVKTTPLNNFKIVIETFSNTNYQLLRKIIEGLVEMLRAMVY